MRRYGVVASAERIASAAASSADHVEPTILGGVLRDGAGGRTLDERASGRRYPSFALLFPRDVPLSDPSAPVEAVWRYLDAVLPLVASVAETDATVVFGSGAARAVPALADRRAAEERFALTLAGTRDRAASHGLRIHLEPLNRGETDLICSLAEAADFLDEHGIEGVPLVADLHHIEREQEPLSHLATFADRIGHAHIAGPGRGALEPDGSRWREFLDALDDLGYAGPVSLECGWGPDFAGELERSLRLMRSR